MRRTVFAQLEALAAVAAADFTADFAGDASLPVPAPLPVTTVRPVLDERGLNHSMPGVRRADEEPEPSSWPPAVSLPPPRPRRALADCALSRYEPASLRTAPVPACHAPVT